MCHQRPAGLVEIEVQRSGHMGVVPSIAVLSKTSPLTSRRHSGDAGVGEAVHVRGHQAAASAQFNGMRGAPWGSLNLQVDRGQLGS